MGYRYIGSKARIVERIIDNLDVYQGQGRFIDAFCGMGHVAVAAADKGWPVLVNDQMMYAGFIAKARLMDSTSISFGNMGSYEETIDRLNELDGREGYFWREYSPASANEIGIERKYFTEANAKKIDAIRLQIMEWHQNNVISEDEHILLLVNLMEAANTVANIAGTYGCFLSKWSSQSQQTLLLKASQLKKGKIDILMSCDDVMNVENNVNDVVYLDPPYTKRQYASYYHILETIAHEDEPVVEGVAGLRPWKEKSSNFCYKIKALNAMVQLVNRIRAKKILISYSNDGHININELFREMEHLGETTIIELDTLNRYKSYINVDNTSVKEYLLILEKTDGNC